MNAYPSWIQRIPEMIGTPALAGTERIDRQAAERWFDLRATAAQALLRRMDAEWCGHALVIRGAVRMARLREAQEHPDWKWEGERRRAIRDRVEATRGLPAGPWSRSPESYGEIWIRSASRNCRRQLSCHPARSLSTARIWSISCSNWFNAPKHWTTITKPCSGSSNRRPLGGLSAPKWLWLPSTRRRRNRM